MHLTVVVMAETWWLRLAPRLLERGRYLADLPERSRLQPLPLREQDAEQLERDDLGDRTDVI